MKVNRLGLELVTDIWNSRVSFDRQTRHLCALYERCFEGINVPKVWKIAVACVEQVDKRWRAEVINQGGVLVTQIKVRQNLFFDASPDQRKKLALQWLHRGALKIAEFHDWPTGPFESARKCVIQHAYINEWIWRKPKSSPSRRATAELFCSFESDRFRAWLRVRSKSGELLKEKLAIDELPSEFCFVPKMGQLKWRTNRQVALLDKYGKKIVEVAVPKLE